MSVFGPDCQETARGHEEIKGLIDQSIGDVNTETEALITQKIKTVEQDIFSTYGGKTIGVLGAGNVIGILGLISFHFDHTERLLTFSFGENTENVTLATLRMKNKQRGGFCKTNNYVGGRQYNFTIGGKQNDDIVFDGPIYLQSTFCFDRSMVNCKFIGNEVGGSMRVFYEIFYHSF